MNQTERKPSAVCGLMASAFYFNRRMVCKGTQRSNAVIKTAKHSGKSGKGTDNQGEQTVPPERARAEGCGMLQSTATYQAKARKTEVNKQRRQKERVQKAAASSVPYTAQSGKRLEKPAFHM